MSLISTNFHCDGQMQNIKMIPNFILMLGKVKFWILILQLVSPLLLTFSARDWKLIAGLLCSRYESVSSSLEKSERERIFDEHIDSLVAKKKDNFRKMLDECKTITLESTFKEIKKLIKDDPRYSRYSSSDRKCEKQFNEYLKDRWVSSYWLHLIN